MVNCFTSGFFCYWTQSYSCCRRTTFQQNIPVQIGLMYFHLAGDGSNWMPPTFWRSAKNHILHGKNGRTGTFSPFRIFCYWTQNCSSCRSTTFQLNTPVYKGGMCCHLTGDGTNWSTLTFWTSAENTFLRSKKRQNGQLFHPSRLFIIVPNAEILVGKQQNVNKTNQLIWEVYTAGDCSNWSTPTFWPSAKNIFCEVKKGRTVNFFTLQDF
jgi:hypothetical protein